MGLVTEDNTFAIDHYKTVFEETHQAILREQATEEFEEKLIRQTNAYQDLTKAAQEAADAQAQEEAAENARAFGDAYTDFGKTLGLNQEQIDAAFVKHEEFTAQMEEEKAAIEAANQAVIDANATYGNYALQAINNTNTTINWKDELFQSASAMGINQEQMITLMDTSGEYTEDQKRRILSEAAMRVAVEQLSEALVNKEITVEGALSALEDLETQLNEDYTAEFDADEIVEAKDQAIQLADSLAQAAGSYTAKFHTEYTTVGTPPSGGGNNTADQPIPVHDGGPFRAGQSLLVGDGPGGQVLAYK